MKKILLIGCLIAFANATDYKSLSTEELVKMKGSVSSSDRDAFKSEMQDRMSKMTPEERSKYNLNSRKGNGQGNGQGMRQNQNGGMR